MENTEGCSSHLREIIRGTFAFCAADPRVPRVLYQSTYGPHIPGVSEFLSEVGRLRFLVTHQVMQDGLDAGELNGGDAASMSLIFCCLMDQHVNLLVRMPRPQKWLLPELPGASHSARRHPRLGQHPPDPPPTRPACRTASGRAREAAATAAAAFVITNRGSRCEPCRRIQDPSDSELPTSQLGQRRFVRRAAG